MATLRFYVQGDPRLISIHDLVGLVSDSFAIVDDLDAALSGEPQGSIDWTLTELSKGSLVLEVESKPRARGSRWWEQHQAVGGTADVALEIARTFVGGLDLIEREPATPPYFSEQSMKRARRLLGLVGREGIERLTVMDGQGEAVISPRAYQNIGPLIPPRRRSVGSVEGRIETISLHGRPRFIVYHGRTKKAVTCKFNPEQWLARVKDVLGARVSVSGVVHSNAKGEPLRVEPREIRTLGRRKELPSTAELSGSDPDLTGDMTTAEFIRSVRGG